MNKKIVEIMAPAGSWETLTAAIQGGANSVYFGIEQLNMRARAANNFKTDELPEIVRTCLEKNVKTYLTLNTILYDHDITLMKKICDTAKAAGVTAVIASDLAAIMYAHSIGFEVHISTQMNVTNIETVKFLAQFADVVVLARELTLKQIKSICDTIKAEKICGPKGDLVQIEIFVHGALCVAVSGKCYMSLATQNASANRGACFQNCRRSYRVIDEENGEELVLDNKYIMSPKDLCTIGFVDQLIEAGVSVFKIEGRGKGPDYVYKVTKAYHEAVQSYNDGSYTSEKIVAWTTELESVFNRGFWHGGYYLGKQLGEWSGQYGSHATEEKVLVGSMQKYYPKPQIAECLIESGEVKKGDRLYITGPTTGFVELTIQELWVNESPAEKAVQGDVMTFSLDKKIRKSDKLFLVVPRHA